MAVSTQKGIISYETCLYLNQIQFGHRMNFMLKSCYISALFTYVATIWWWALGQWLHKRLLTLVSCIIMVTMSMIDFLNILSIVIRTFLWCVYDEVLNNHAEKNIEFVHHHVYTGTMNIQDIRVFPTCSHIPFPWWYVLGPVPLSIRHLRSRSAPVKMLRIFAFPPPRLSVPYTALRDGSACKHLKYWKVKSHILYPPRSHKFSQNT